MGDTADGYAGVKGIGEKTAIKLIQQYQSVENVVENIDALSAGQRNKINDNLDELYLSKRLAEIHTQVPIDSEALLRKCHLQQRLIIFYQFATNMNYMFQENIFHLIFKSIRFYEKLNQLSIKRLFLSIQGRNSLLRIWICQSE